MVSFVGCGPIISSACEVYTPHALYRRNLVLLLKSNPHNPIKGVPGSPRHTRSECTTKLNNRIMVLQWNLTHGLNTIRRYCVIIYIRQFWPPYLSLIYFRSMLYTPIYFFLSSTVPITYVFVSPYAFKHKYTYFSPNN